MPVWKRRYGFEVIATIERIDLPPEIAGDLFRIVQEAVVNAGRHAHARHGRRSTCAASSTRSSSCA